MAQLSQSDVNIIASNPNDASLWALGKDIKDTWSPTGVSSIDQILAQNPATVTTFAQHIALSLLNQKAALSLPSRRQQAPLSADIALLYSQITSGSQNLAVILPILRAVYDGANDATLWAAVYSVLGSANTVSQAPAVQHQQNPLPNQHPSGQPAVQQPSQYSQAAYQGQQTSQYPQVPQQYNQGQRMSQQYPQGQQPDQPTGQQPYHQPTAGQNTSGNWSQSPASTNAPGAPPGQGSSDGTNYTVTPSEQPKKKSIWSSLKKGWKSRHGSSSSAQTSAAGSSSSAPPSGRPSAPPAAKSSGAAESSRNSVPPPPASSKRSSGLGFLKSKSKKKEEEDEKPPDFVLKVDNKLWPGCETGPSNNSLTGTGQLLIDFTVSLASQWAKGANVGNQFCRPLFQTEHPNGLPPDQLPERLFDLVAQKVVLTSQLGSVNYAAVSHVWGAVRQLDGKPYGVEWSIPVIGEAKLQQIFEAARIVIGERYLWIDILCLDQRKRNEAEIAMMKSYYANATGCFVWLDNTYGEPGWDEALAGIKEVNDFYKMDEYGTPTVDPTALLQGNFADRTFNDSQAFKFIKKIVAIEKAPWFKRVWTLQEAVIPENLYFVTPERYMTAGANFFQLIGMCELIANTLVSVGSMAGVAVSHELQRSEIYKTLKLRQLYRQQEISYWHLAQAVRSRDCKYEQDRVFGVLGLVHGALPAISYNRLTESLYQDLYRTYIENGDFSTAMFIGGSSVFPDKDISMGFLRSGAAPRQETHSISLIENGLQMTNVGYDTLKQYHCILGTGPLQAWTSQSPEFLSLGFEIHKQLAVAFELAPELMPGSELCPAAFAIYAALSLTTDNNPFQAFKPEFQELLYKNVPPALLTWIKATMFMQKRDDSALVVIWTHAGDPQIALVTEEIEGQAVMLTPSSFVDEPGIGCLICKVLPDGSLKKIGVGLGKQVKAVSRGNFIVV